MNTLLIYKSFQFQNSSILQPVELVWKNLMRKQKVTLTLFRVSTIPNHILFNVHSPKSRRANLILMNYTVPIGSLISGMSHKSLQPETLNCQLFVEKHLVAGRSFTSGWNTLFISKVKSSLSLLVRLHFCRPKKTRSSSHSVHKNTNFLEQKVFLIFQNLLATKVHLNTKRRYSNLLRLPKGVNAMQFKLS